MPQSSKSWELWDSEILGALLHALIEEKNVSIFHLLFKWSFHSLIFNFFFHKSSGMLSLLCWKLCLSSQNIQLMLVKINMTKYCVQINNNNGYIFGKNPQPLSLPQAVCSLQFGTLGHLKLPETTFFPLLSVLSSEIFMCQKKDTFVFL